MTELITNYIFMCCFISWIFVYVKEENKQTSQIYFTEFTSLMSKDNVFTKYSGYQICNGFIFISMLVYFFSLTIICFKHPCIHCWIIQSWNYINMIVLGCNMLYKRWHRPTSFSIGFYKYDKTKYHYNVVSL